MPDIITHILYGQDIMNELEDSKWQKTILKNKELFILGCQGPDIFFYNDFWPWIKKKRGPEIGKSMHLNRTGDFFIEGLKYVKNNIDDETEKATLFTYLSGFMCHFTLDRRAHPYIFYFTGQYDEKRPETHHYKGFHKRLEIVIDAILLKEKKGLESYKYKIHEQIDTGKILPKVIKDFYDYVFEVLYDFGVDGRVVNDSYKNIKQVLKYIYDPHGIKKSGLHILDCLIKDKVKYSNLIYPRNIDKRVDYMNTKRDKWTHPCDKDEVYTYSFFDIFNKALGEGKDMILKSINFLDGKCKFSEVRELFPNVTYTTGRPSDDDCEQKYFSPLFE